MIGLQALVIIGLIIRQTKDQIADTFSLRADRRAPRLRRRRLRDPGPGAARRRFRSPLLATLVIVLTACSQTPMLLKRPDDGHIVQCSRAAWGLIPYLQVQEEYKRCVAEARKAGYIPIRGAD